MNVKGTTYLNLKKIGAYLEAGDDAKLIESIEAMGLEQLFDREMLLLARTLGQSPVVILIATLMVENGHGGDGAVRLLGAYQSVLEKKIKPVLAERGSFDLTTQTVGALITKVIPDDFPVIRRNPNSVEWIENIELALDFKRPELALALVRKFVARCKKVTSLRTAMLRLSQRHDLMPGFVDWSSFGDCYLALEAAHRPFTTPDFQDDLYLFIASAMQKAGRLTDAIAYCDMVRPGRFRQKADLILSKAYCMAGDYEKSIQKIDSFLAGVCELSNQVKSTELVEEAVPVAKNVEEIADFDGDGARLALSDLQETLAPLGLRPFLVFGTLLGYVRNGGFLSHDKDIDVGVVGWTEQFDMVQALQTSGKFQFGTQSLRGKGAYIIPIVHRESEITIDIFLFHDEGDRFLTGINSSWGYTQLFGYSRFELNTVEFLGMNVQVPDNIEQNLEETYGNWRVPDKYWLDIECPAVLDPGGIIHMLVCRLTMMAAVIEVKPVTLRRSVKVISEIPGAVCPLDPDLEARLIAMCDAQIAGSSSMDFKGGPTRC